MTDQKGLEIDDDIRHHERAWLMKKILWALMIVFVLAVILGYVGGGESSIRTITSNKMSVTYHRYAHSSAPTLMSISLSYPLEDTVAIVFTNDYMSKINIENIIPEPVSVAAGDGIVTYFFLADKKLGKDKLKVDYLMNADKFGSYNFSVMTRNDRVNLNQFIFP
jgi:hypothetical protein